MYSTLLYLLLRQGVPSDCAYIVLNGRLRSVLKKSDGKREMVEEMGRGETVGLVRSNLSTQTFIQLILLNMRNY